MRRILLGLALLTVGLGAASPVAHADVNNFTISDFSANETLTNADRQGKLHIVERIKVDFTDNNHGITRAIPKTYKGNSLRFHLNSVTSDSGAPTAVKTSSQNGNVILRIGDADRTVTGAQEYTIDYTVSNVISFYDDHDELYWDVNGDQWQQQFTSVTTTLTLPDGASVSRKPQCFTGTYGSSASDCVVTSEGQTVRIDASNLAAQQTLTYVIGFEKGYFAKATLIERFEENAGPILEIAVPILAALIIGFFWWLRSGRDAKGRGTIVPEYGAPEGITPLDAGTITDFKVDNRDLTATLIDLARRGYIRIIENRQDRKLLKDKVSYSLKLRNADWSACNAPEQKLLGELFAAKTVAETISLDDSKNKLYTAAADLRKTVSADLTSRGYFKQDPSKFAKYGSISFTAVFIIVYLFGEFASHTSFLPFIIGAVGGGLILLLFMRIIPARTTKGVTVNEQLQGLKLYMETAEKDRLAMLEGPEAAYAANAGAPVRTVELFEKLLPYAIVMQVETKWADKFDDIYTSPPDWYAGNWTAFNAGYLAGSLNSGFAAAVNNSFSAPSNSGSSGFGGGGFSGGGGAGGGGGGW